MDEPKENNEVNDILHKVSSDAALKALVESNADEETKGIAIFFATAMKETINMNLKAYNFDPERITAGIDLAFKISIAARAAVAEERQKINQNLN